MGYIKKQWLIVNFFDFKDEKKSIKKVNNFIKKLGNKKRFFYKNTKKTNGYITFFMDWDGSKEGWNTSNDFDKIRESFINLIKKIAPESKIIHICDDENEDNPYAEVV